MIKKIVLLLSLIVGLISCKSGKEQRIATTNDAPIGVNIGNKAPELEYANPNDSIIKLSSLKGYYVLIDFWASWCGPCRYENPNVVKAYTEYKDKKFINKAKGFVVYNVSLDQNKEAWKKAIAADKLTWPYHVSDLKGWSSAPAAKYGVNSIPINWLIDPNGIIIAKELRGPTLEAKLKELVKQ